MEIVYDSSILFRVYVIDEKEEDGVAVIDVHGAGCMVHVSP